MNKKIIWGVIIGIVVIIGGLIWAAQTYKCIDDCDGHTRVIENPVMKDWKTYTNEKSGFYFKYPKDWEVDTAQNLSVYLVNPQKVRLSGLEVPIGALAIDFAQAPCIIKNWEQNSGQMNYKTFCITSGNQKININAAAFDDLGKNTIEKIVSTFKFTN